MERFLRFAGSVKLSPYDSDLDAWSVVVETPKGSRNKNAWDEKRGVFRLKTVLPAGAVFPYDFGYIPGTEGDDGDPLDVLLLMDEPAFPGCLVPSRLIGVIEARQGEDGSRERNDRLIAVSTDSPRYRDVKEIGALEDVLLSEIEHFFVSYNEFRGKSFEPLGRFGSKRAVKLVERGIVGRKKRPKRRSKRS
jgi:inorganic pyrophosphatase